MVHDLGAHVKMMTSLSPNISDPTLHKTTMNISILRNITMTSHEQVTPSDHHLTAHVVYLCVLSVMVMLTNMTVIMTLILKRNMISISTKYFLYVINLALCDFVVGCFLIPVYIAFLLGKL